ncbi:class I SAM-dependent DNA methyltransferase [Methanobacterium aggregans]|uniref:class I SAM-dependent DNA methyltransferase n=1 Tax=Methanobacterium aggregans TaxID=1615586 RepID=UPI001AE995C2|nr:class I SAM-dependent methyltransferase [Methanobacterium aggregans]MBP2045619.1 ubiquinone/menaquinone biosynthesis C-methylase UbiE [Methanobacterium aggregans]
MGAEDLYKKFAGYYDRIYENVDYAGESEFIKWAIENHKESDGNKILDVACGTGTHASILAENFQVLGVDINKNMLKIAHKKVPEVRFIHGDMKELDLGDKFDAVICMFSAIHYNTSYFELENTLKNFYNHLNDGGVVIFDFGLNKENWIEGLVSMDTVVEDDLKLARICQSHLEGTVFNANFLFLVKEKGKLDFDIDQHQLGVFEMEKALEIMTKTGFETSIYADFSKKEWEITEGERPVFVGVKQSKSPESC